MLQGAWESKMASKVRKGKWEKFNFSYFPVRNFTDTA